MTNSQAAQGLSLFSQGKPLFFFLPDGRGKRLDQQQSESGACPWILASAKKAPG
jgi:hypothetical protein